MSNVPAAYRFSCFYVHSTEKELLREGKRVPLAPKVFDTLLLLLENQGRLVEKTEFLNRLWPDIHVEDVGLAHAISQLRKALRDGMGGSSFIETVPKRGYRFRVPVEVVGTGAGETASRATLGVLPVENLGPASDLEYLASGLTEELIAVLGQVDPEHIGVIGRTTMMAYKNTTKSLAGIGRELDAGFLLESSIRGEGASVRMTSRLIRTQDQVQIWSATCNSEPGSVLEFQRELSATIAQQIRVRLSPERLNRLALRQPRHVDAYDLYLRGRYFWTQLSPLTTRRALEFYTRATEIDHDYALAWSGLADAYASSPINGDAPPLQVWPRARDAVAHAIGAAPNLAEAQASLGLMKFWLDWDWGASETAFRSALQLDPGYGLAHRTLGILLSQMKRHDAARLAMQTARELDPLDFVHLALSAQVSFFARDYPAAVGFARRASVLDPEFWVGYYQLAQACEQLGESEPAFEALQKAGQFSGGNSKVIALRGYLFAKLGRIGEALEVLNTLEAVSRERYVPPYATALVLVGLGRHDQALDWLDRAYDAHDVHLLLLPIDPKWDALRADTRLPALIKRCGFDRFSTQVALQSIPPDSDL
jgi:DNA-binding winged helix-turn-helix (wHTH) protein/tetratricopeptide (TPR) repeat protein